jgi:hypothetical protein
MALATWPLNSIGIAVLSLADERLGPMPVDQRQCLPPGRQVEPLDQPGRTIGHDRRSTKLVACDLPCDGVFCSSGIGSGDPIATIAVALAALGCHHLKLRRWAHMLGYRGHWTTRSRRYSTTFTALRAQRQAHARARAHQTLGHHDGDQDQAVIVLASWTYAGRGHRSEAERWLALAAAAHARQHRRLAREELSSSSRAA